MTAFCLLAALGAAAAVPRKVIIDTDPGTDDAVAILLALSSPELDLQALTVVPGNVPLRQGLENALQVVSLAGRCEVPVATGAERPLVQPLLTAEFVHGENGLANLQLPRPACRADARFGPDLIIELVHQHPGEITLVPIGPLTNIALAVRKDPSIVPLVKEVILMGGSISGGNVTPAAEFNIYNDPEAAQIVFHAGWALTMVGLEVGNMALFTREHLSRLVPGGSLASDLAASILKFMVKRGEEFGFPGTPLYDPLAVGVALDRTLALTQPMRVDVETRGEFTRGETVVNQRNLVERSQWQGDRYVVVGADKVQPNTNVCVQVDAERFLRLVLARLGGK